jgi:hypothetical protein
MKMNVQYTINFKNQLTKYTRQIHFFLKNPTKNKQPTTTTIQNKQRDRQTNKQAKDTKRARNKTDEWLACRVASFDSQRQELQVLLV